MPEKLVDYTALDEEVVASILQPKVGLIKINEHRPPFNAIYLEDGAQRIIAYITYTPFWRDEKTMLIESFTNKAARKQGVQKRLNQELIRVLKLAGVENLVGDIMLNNTASFLNRTSMKNPDGDGVLQVESSYLDLYEQELREKGELTLSSLQVRISLTKVVPNNNAFLERVRKIQEGLVSSQRPSTYV